MAAWRARPSAVQQGILTCWAAAISSFSRITPGVPSFPRVEDVIAHFERVHRAELNPDGSLRVPSGMVAFADEFKLRIEEVRLRRPSGAGAATSGIPSTVADDLGPRHFVSKLKRSHVIVVTGTDDPRGHSHTVVVYGADNLRLCFMDPLSDPSLPPLVPRPRGGSGQVAENWFCETYNDFGTHPRYLMTWRG